jgi:tetratricopeptide (TPR) repeat protein
VKRREFLGWIVAAAGPTAVVDLERLASPIIDAGWLQDAEYVSIGLAAQREAVEAAVLLPAVLGHLASLESRLPASAELTARTAVLAGDLLLGYRRPIGGQTRQRLGDAYRCFALAETLGSPAVATKSMLSTAGLYEQRGDLSLALALAEEAVNRRAAALAMVPWLLARRAELHARNGSDTAAMRDLNGAESALAGPEDWWSMSPRGAVELAAYRGAVLSTLGRHREAADALTWVLERMDRSKVMWRAAVAADRDAALAQL